MRLFIPMMGVLALFACADAPTSFAPPESPKYSHTSPPNDTLTPPAVEEPVQAAPEEAIVEEAKPVAADKARKSAPPARRQTSSVSPTPPTARGTGPKKAVPAGFSDIQELDPSISIDIKYASTDNFTHTQIYDCGRCLLRTEAAEALVKVHKSLQKKGLGLKMYDCYRPRPYQQRLWDKVPNPDYVTPPAKGSMHSRGAAVDLTLVDAQGKELEMGTPYDYFGKEAHTDYLQHPKKVLQNRNTLRDALLEQGFKGIRTEWWHFSYQKRSFPFSSALWKCP